MRRFWMLYAAGWVPIALFYAVATQGDSFMRGQLNIIGALFGAAWGLGPAPLLLTLVWPLTGWLERRAAAPLSLVAVHTVAAVLFTLVWHALVFAFLYLHFGAEDARRAATSWFVWQAMWGLMMYAVVAGVFHAVRAVEKGRAQAVAAAVVIAQSESLRTRSELAALRNKLNPHFLFNTLHSIIALTRSDAKAAEIALLKFSDMLRYVLDAEKNNVERVTLSEELQFVRDYLDLEALRLGTRLKVHWHIDVHAEAQLVPALSIQPLVENSIRHAFNQRIQSGVLTIRARQDATAQQLDITIADDGPGCEPGRLGQGNGLGVRTIERRLALEYGGSASLNIHTAPGNGFSVQLLIPTAAA